MIGFVCLRTGVALLGVRYLGKGKAGLFVRAIRNPDRFDPIASTLPIKDVIGSFLPIAKVSDLLQVGHIGC